jgi:hypothetical protein
MTVFHHGRRLKRVLSLWRLSFGVLLASFLSTAAWSADVATGSATSEKPDAEPGVTATTPAGVRRGLIICGLAGDAEHHRTFSETIAKLHAGMVAQLGFQAENITVLFGDEPDDKDPALVRNSARSTRQAVAAAIKQLQAQSKPQDGAWILLMGHCHFDGKDSWFNLPGPDYSQTEFGALLDQPVAGEQVLLLTFPVSGQWIKPASAPRRVVITATEAGWETNETEFAAALATLLETPPEPKDFDVDSNGQITLFDLYIATCRQLAQSYVERELLATEHPLLDDNGDGRGTELQIDYLSEDLGGRVRRGRLVPPKTAAGTDGALAKLILLRKAEQAP